MLLQLRGLADLGSLALLSFEALLLQRTHRLENFLVVTREILGVELAIFAGSKHFSELLAFGFFLLLSSQVRIGT